MSEPTIICPQCKTATNLIESVLTAMMNEPEARAL